MTGITAITSLKFDVGCDIGRGYGTQRELYLKDSTLAVWSGKWCRVCIGLPNLKEIRIGCEVLYHSACWYFWDVDEGTTDFSHLIGISIVVEPEEVDNSSIDEFDGEPCVHFEVSHSSISIEQDKASDTVFLHDSA